MAGKAREVGTETYELQDDSVILPSRRFLPRRVHSVLVGEATNQAMRCASWVCEYERVVRELCASTSIPPQNLTKLGQPTAGN